MKLYFASNGKQQMEWLVKNNVKNILFSFAYVQKCEQLNFIQGKNLLIDSGAFTAWTKGRQINIEEYAEYIKTEVIKLQKTNKVDIINLDVIPAKFGSKPTKEEREYSAEQGWKNYVYMKSKGIDCIHTFHMYEDFSWLERLMKESKYIGISPANDASVKDRIAWLKKVYWYTRTNVKTHILGLSSKNVLEIVPAYSADSIRWQTGAMFGNAIGVKKGKLSQFLTRTGKTRAWKHNTTKILQEERYLTDLWKLRGIKWD